MPSYDTRNLALQNPPHTAKAEGTGNPAPSASDSLATLRVLLISHTCQSRTEGQPKAEMLGGLPGITLRVLTPDRWRHYGRWRAAENPAEGAAFDFQTGKVFLPWAGPARSYLHWYPGLAALLQSFRPDVIDLWEEPWGLVSAHACWLRNRLLPDAKIVSETEQNLSKVLPLPFEKLRSYTLRNADHAVARNREAVSVLRSKGYAGPVDVVGNAVDTSLFRPLDRSDCRREFGLAPKAFIAGYAGRLVEEKGLTDLVDALPHLEAGARLVFVGDGPLKPELERKAAVLGLSDRVQFFAAQPPTRLVRFMNALDVLVLPSRTTPRWKEQFGRVVIEAHACGVPVVGSSSGAIPDVVGGGGVIFREGDPLELAAALRRLASSPSEAAEMGDVGRRRVEAEYTWQRVAEKMAAIYRRVMQPDKWACGKPA